MYRLPKLVRVEDIRPSDTKANNSTTNEKDDLPKNKVQLHTNHLISKTNNDAQYKRTYVQLMQDTKFINYSALGATVSVEDFKEIKTQKTNYDIIDNKSIYRGLYDGELARDTKSGSVVPHGQGKITIVIDDQEIEYNGKFEYGIFLNQGIGRIYVKNKYTYEGEIAFFAEKLLVPHGQGSFTYDNQEAKQLTKLKIDGHWTKGQLKEGDLTSAFKSGEKYYNLQAYVSDYNSVIDLKLTTSNSNDKSDPDLFIKGRYNTNTEQFTGEVKNFPIGPKIYVSSNAIENGDGIISSDTGERLYKGQLRDGFPHGNGQIILDNGKGEITDEHWKSIQLPKKGNETYTLWVPISSEGQICNSLIKAISDTGAEVIIQGGGNYFYTPSHVYLKLEDLLANIWKMVNNKRLNVKNAQESSPDKLPNDLKFEKIVSYVSKVKSNFTKHFEHFKNIIKFSTSSYKQNVQYFKDNKHLTFSNYYFPTLIKVEDRWVSEINLANFLTEPSSALTKLSKIHIFDALESSSRHYYAQFHPEKDKYQESVQTMETDHQSKDSDTMHGYFKQSPEQAFVSFYVDDVNKLYKKVGTSYLPLHPFSDAYTETIHIKIAQHGIKLLEYLKANLNIKTLSIGCHMGVNRSFAHAFALVVALNLDGCSQECLKLLSDNPEYRKDLFVNLGLGLRAMVINFNTAWNGLGELMCKSNSTLFNTIGDEILTLIMDSKKT